MTQGPRDEDLIDLDIARAKRPVLSGPTTAPVVTMDGRAYVAKFPGDLHLRLTDLVEHRDEVTGLLTVFYKPAGTVAGRIGWQRINLTSGATRASFAKQLSSKVDADWGQFLEVFCYEVFTMARQGAPESVSDDWFVPKPGREYLLDPILPMGLPTNLYGPGGVGKSTLACGIAYSVETGREVVAGWKPLSGPVLILDWEGREEDWRERWSQIARGVGGAYGTLRYRPCRRRLKDDIEFVTSLVSKYSIALVVVDSVSLAFGTSPAEGDPADSALNAFAAIREVGEVTWLLIDHVTGESTEQGYVATKAYGSVKKRDLARSMFHVAGAREAADTQELVITHTKSNYSRPLKPQGVVIERDQDRLVFTRTSELQAPELAEKMPMGDRIRSLLVSGAHSPEWVREQLGVDAKDRRAAGAFKVALHRLVKTGLVTKLPSGELGLAAPAHQESFA